MRKFDLVVIVLCAALCLFFIGLLFFEVKSTDVRKLNMYYQVANKMGFNTDTDALYFGKGYPGSVTRRHIQLNNSYPYPILVNIKVEGDIAKFISVSDNDFVIQPGEIKGVTYFVTTEGDTPYGNYSGVTTIFLQKTR